VQAKSNTNYIDAAFAKIVATKRNATAWNYSAELFMKRKNVFNIENLSEEPSIIPDYANGTVKFTKNPLDNITLLDEATYNKLATDGWRFTEKTEYLGWLDPANPLNFDTWKNPNATASKEAWDRTIADAKSNITAYDAALAKIVATKRNATVWDYSAELAQKRKDVIKQIAPDPGNYNLKPEQRIINKTEMENNHSKGFVINQYSMLLNQLDLGNPNITNNESALLASAQPLAEKYIRKLLNETPDAVNGYYEMSAERNKTNPNLINAMFVAKVQKLYQGGLLTVVGSPIADYGAWLNATDNDIVSNDKIDTIQDNDIALFWYGNQTIKYNGSTLTASEVYSLLEGMPFPDATKYFEFKAVPFNNFTPPASWGCTPLKKLSPYYELDKWPKKVFLLTEILKVKN
jgi:hypothetical protein